MLAEREDCIRLTEQLRELFVSKGADRIVQDTWWHLRSDLEELVGIVETAMGHALVQSIRRKHEATTTVDEAPQANGDGEAG